MEIRSKAIVALITVVSDTPVKLKYHSIFNKKKDSLSILNKKAVLKMNATLSTEMDFSCAR